jgi:aminocarboxymuconate-semialdehyde decarboxylase
VTRRELLQQTAGVGLLFASCGRQIAAEQTAPVAAHQPVMLNGRRIRTVDVHAHCIVPEALRLLAKPVNRQAELPLTGEPLAARLAAMDARRIDTAVLSIVPNWYDAERELAARVVEIQNEQLAAFCASRRDRFAALATVAMQFPDLASDQLERAVRRFGFRGVGIATTVGGMALADRRFDPFWRKAESLDAVVFVHPIDLPDPTGRLAGNGVLGKVIGHPLETTIALSHLIFEGTLDRHPGLKICAAHGGGYLASYAHRSDHGCSVFPDQCTSGVPAHPPSAYLRRMYFDSLVFEPEALRHLAAEVGADRVLMGTDFPYPWVADPVDHILKTPGLGDADREAMLGGTAARLFL